MQFKSCINCKDRKVGCHSICEKYLNEVKENEKLKEKKRIENNIRGYISTKYSKIRDYNIKNNKKKGRIR